jgi:archaellum component FlaF (FlaF/FlaG flagellin family)
MIKVNKHTILGYFVGVISTVGITVFAASTILSKNITYSNSNSNVDNVEDALNELYDKSNECSNLKTTPSTFSYNGSSQEYTAQVSGYYKFEAWGAQGNG